VNTNFERSSGDFDLRDRVVQIQIRKIGSSPDAHAGVVGLQLRDAVRFGPDMVAGGDRMIHLRGRPVVDTCGLKGNSSGEVTQARDPSGRGWGLREGRRYQECAESGNEEKSCGHMALRFE
jgi:hypothetical protein